jgi:hypothetical protein
MPCRGRSFRGSRLCNERSRSARAIRFTTSRRSSSEASSELGRARCSPRPKKPCLTSPTCPAAAPGCFHI